MAGPERTLRAREQLSNGAPERIFEIRSEGADLLHLLGGCRLLEAFAREERLAATPDERGVASFGHQPRRADIAESVVDGIRAAFHECDEPVALQDEMGSDFRRDDLYPSGRQLLKYFDHIL